LPETKNNISTENINNEKNITIKKSTYYNIVKGIVAVITIVSFIGGYSLGSLETHDYSDSISAETLKEMLSKLESAPVLQPTQISTPPQTIQVSFDDDPIKGDPDAPLTIVEFSDFQCPFCGQFFQQTLPSIEKNYIDTGKVNFVYRDMPLYNIHPNVGSVHIASECAHEQEKFWEYHDMLFKNQVQWSSLSANSLDFQLKQYAATLGLNSTSFESCLVSPELANEIEQDILHGTQYGVTGTPTFFIGNQENGYVKLVGAQPYIAFQNIIDGQLK